MLMKQGHLEEAAAAFEVALSVAPLHADVWFSLGAIYLRIDGDGHSARAAKAFVRCLGVDEEDAQAWGNLSAVYSRSTDLLEQAKICGWEAVKRSNTSWKLWENYQIICMQLNDVQGALNAERALSLTLNRNDHPCPRVLGRCSALVETNAKDCERLVSLLADLAAANKGGWKVLALYAAQKEKSGDIVASWDLQIRCLRALVGNLENEDAVDGLELCLSALTAAIRYAEANSVGALVMTLKSIPKRLSALGKPSLEIANLCEKLQILAQEGTGIRE